MIAIAITVLVGFQNCSPVDFAADTSSKLDGGGGPEIATDCTSGLNCDEPPPPPFRVTESITTQVTNKVDVLVIVDNSGSMDVERAALGSRLKSFLDPLQGLDWRVCVTSSDVGVEKGQPVSFPNGSKVLTPATTDAEAQFLDAVTKIKGGSGDEQPVKAQYLAFTNPSSTCYRADAALVTVSLSDEDERSTGGYTKFENDSQFKQLTAQNFPTAAREAVQLTWGRQKVFTAHSIVIKSGDTACHSTQAGQNNNAYYGTRLEQLAALTDGKVGNICANDYSSQLTSIGNQVRTTTAALTLQGVPLSMPSVTLPPQYASTQVSNSGDKLYFLPELPAGVSVSLSYMCPGKK